LPGSDMLFIASPPTRNVTSSMITSSISRPGNRNR
jgi:hypothetical protein